MRHVAMQFGLLAEPRIPDDSVRSQNPLASGRRPEANGRSEPLDTVRLSDPGSLAKQVDINFLLRAIANEA